MKNKIIRLIKVLVYSLRNLKNTFKALESNFFAIRGLEYILKKVELMSNKTKASNKSEIQEDNPIKRYFDSHTEGNGIWKWNHYFDIYHTFFKRFIDKEINLVEIGIYSGGSLDMWRSYFGNKCVIFGIDIQNECKSYEKEGVNIHIGDQADRNFWKKFVQEVIKIDIVIDDGGHTTEQQIVTFEEVFPYISPGGVYLCEDIQGSGNNFLDYMQGIQKQLNYSNPTKDNNFKCITNYLQKTVKSIHIYPYVVVIEKNLTNVDLLAAPKQGTKWEPFL
jgi:cephalosporin hydroxylase